MYLKSVQKITLLVSVQKITLLVSDYVTQQPPVHHPWETCYGTVADEAHWGYKDSNYDNLFCKSSSSFRALTLPIN
jgi:hypothetical protein